MSSFRRLSSFPRLDEASSPPPLPRGIFLRSTLLRSLSFSFSIFFSSFSISFHRLARSSREISPFSYMLKRDCSQILRCIRAATSPLATPLSLGRVFDSEEDE